jgi:glycyl-tRNA synthetase
VFVERRLQGVLLEMGFPFDVVEAVLAVRGDNPCGALRACRALSQTVQEPWWSEAFVAYARCARIVRDLDTLLPLAPDRYVEEVERQLHAAYEAAETRLQEATEPAESLGEVLRSLQDPINAYFDGVLVNAEDPEIRKARLGLVQHIAKLPSRIADLSKLQGF